MVKLSNSYSTFIIGKANKLCTFFDSSNEENIRDILANLSLWDWEIESTIESLSSCLNMENSTSSKQMIVTKKMTAKYAFLHARSELIKSWNMCIIRCEECHQFCTYNELEDLNIPEYIDFSLYKK
jgi:hypothetical protein